MTNDSLRERLELLRQIKAELKEIGELYDGLPTDSDLDDMWKEAAGLVSLLKEVRKQFSAPDFPTTDDLKELAESLQN